MQAPGPPPGAPWPQAPRPAPPVPPLAAFLALQVGPEEAGQAVGAVVRRRWRLSLTLYRRLKARGGLLVNGRPVPAFFAVGPGDRIELALPAVAPALPQPIPLVVAYEDDHLLVVDKPAGLVMHPARGHPDGTLVNGVVHHRLARGEPPWVHPVHRLDKDTSGLVLIAKNPYVHERLLRSRRFGRSYLAVLEGHLPVDSGVVAFPIQEPAGEGLPAFPSAGRPAALAGGPAASAFVGRRIASPAGRPARTRFRVVRRLWLEGRPATLVVVRLGSGRTHQIRVHMSALGFPVRGDPRYGSPGESAHGRPAPPVGERAAEARVEGAPVGPPGRLMLHARKLWLVHPITGRRLLLRSTPPFPGVPVGL